MANSKTTLPFALAWLVTLGGELRRLELRASPPQQWARCYHIQPPPPPLSMQLPPPHACAPAGGIIVLGALGALTNDSEVSPIIPPYRERFEPPRPPLPPLCPSVDFSYLPRAARSQQRGLHWWHGVHWCHQCSHHLPRPLPCLATTAAPSPNRSNASHVFLHYAHATRPITPLI